MALVRSVGIAVRATPNRTIWRPSRTVRGEDITCLRLSMVMILVSYGAGLLESQTCR